MNKVSQVSRDHSVGSCSALTESKNECLIAFSTVILSSGFKASN